MRLPVPCPEYSLTATPGAAAGNPGGTPSPGPHPPALGPALAPVLAPPRPPAAVSSWQTPGMLRLSHRADVDAPRVTGNPVEVHYWAGLEEGKDSEEEAVVFPDEDARLLARVLDDWAHSFKGAEGWDTSGDTVDDYAQWQTLIYSHKRDEDDERRTGYNPYPVPAGGVPGYRHPQSRSQTWEAVGPLAEALHRDVFLPRMRQYGNEDVPMQYLFMRKYSPLSRSTIKAHQDSTVMTFNVALSDRDKCDGGHLFVCDPVPQSFANMMAFQAPPPEARHAWFELLHPEAEYMSGKGQCRSAQPPMGSMVSHRGMKFHGVQPIRGGTRFSLIAFYGETRTSPKDFDKARNATLASTDDAVKALPDSVAETWLFGLQSLAGAGAHRNAQCIAFDGEPSQAGLELTRALEHFMGNPGHTATILEIIGGLSAGDWRPEDVRRELASRQVVELVLQARKLHAGDANISQLACSALRHFRCGSQSCADSTPGCSGDIDAAEESDGEEEGDGDKDESEEEEDMEMAEYENDLSQRTPEGMNRELTSEMEGLFKECDSLMADIKENREAGAVPRKCLGLLRWSDFDTLTCETGSRPDEAQSQRDLDRDREAYRKMAARGSQEL